VNPKNDSPRPFAVLRTAFPPQLGGYRAQNQVALHAKLMVYFRGIGSKKIITIRSQTPPIACESERDQLCSKNNKSLVSMKWGYPSLLTKTGFRGCFLRGNSPGSRARARVCARKLVLRRLAGIFLPPMSRARAVDQRVAAVVPGI
jgi:hypothetical protein